MLSLTGVILFVLAVNIARKRAKVKADEFAEFETMRTSVTLIGGAVALILVLVGAVLILGGDQELLRGVGFTSQDDITSGRIHFWETTLKMIRDYPILGVGLNAFGTAYPQYDTWNGNFRVENAHNDYLQILAEAGIPGLIAAASFIFLLFKNGLATIGETADRLRRDIAVGSLAGCFGVLIHSFFDFPLRTTSNAFFFLLLAAFAIRKHLGRTAK
jgi:O-antigen ligase